MPPPTRRHQRGHAACRATPTRRHHRAHVVSAVPPRSRRQGTPCIAADLFARAHQFVVGAPCIAPHAAPIDRGRGHHGTRTLRAAAPHHRTPSSITRRPAPMQRAGLMARRPSMQRAGTGALRATHGGCCKTRPSAVFEHDPGGKVLTGHPLRRWHIFRGVRFWKFCDSLHASPLPPPATSCPNLATSCLCGDATITQPGHGATSVVMRPAARRQPGAITVPMLCPRCRHAHGARARPASRRTSSRERTNSSWARPASRRTRHQSIADAAITARERFVLPRRTTARLPASHDGPHQCSARASWHAARPCGVRVQGPYGRRMRRPCALRRHASDVTQPLWRRCRLQPGTTTAFGHHHAATNTAPPAWSCGLQSDANPAPSPCPCCVRGAATLTAPGHVPAQRSPAATRRLIGGARPSRHALHERFLLPRGTTARPASSRDAAHQCRARLPQTTAGSASSRNAPHRCGARASWHATHQCSVRVQRPYGRRMEAVAELPKTGTSKNVPLTERVSRKDFFA